MTKLKKTRILICKPGLDGRDGASRCPATLLAKEGCELTRLGLYNSSEMVIRSALEEEETSMLSTSAFSRVIS